MSSKPLSGKILVSAMAFLMAVTLVTGLWGNWLAQPGPLEEEKIVVVPRGSSVKSMANILKKEGVIDNSLKFELGVRATFLQGSLQAGGYSFGPKISVRTIIGKLATGDVARYKFTVPEGLTAAEVVVKLKNEKRLTGLVPDVEEGMLLPETYSFVDGDTRADLVKRMRKGAEDALALAWDGRSGESNVLTSAHELLTLASIVEKETSQPEEYETVASVYINRLNKGMRLEADPTVIYGASNYNGNIRRKHLKEDHPYNTYVHKGLPPGPIANPGKATMIATARPAKTDYLFFVADGKGGHVFALTYDEHQKNVKEYLKAYRKLVKNK